MKAGYLAGWTSSIKLGSFANVTLNGGSGTGVPNTEYVDFAFQVTLDSTTFKSGGSLTFPTTQICQDGTTKAWDGEESPLLKITDGTGTGTGNSDGTTTSTNGNGNAIAIAALVIALVALLLAGLIILKINTLKANTIQPQP